MPPTLPVFAVLAPDRLPLHVFSYWRGNGHASCGAFRVQRARALFPSSYPQTLALLCLPEHSLQEESIQEKSVREGGLQEQGRKAVTWEQVSAMVPRQEASVLTKAAVIQTSLP